jgi:integral membrane sensor domain MASE1
MIISLFNLSDYLPSFSAVINMAFSLLAFTPLVGAFGYVLTMFYYRKPPEMLRIVELLVGTFLISVVLYAFIPWIVQYLGFFGA